MLVPSDMIGPQSKLMFQVRKFYDERVSARKFQVAKTIHEICAIVQVKQAKSIDYNRYF